MCFLRRTRRYRRPPSLLLPHLRSGSHQHALPCPSRPSPRKNTPRNLLWNSAWTPHSKRNFPRLLTDSIGENIARKIRLKDTEARFREAFEVTRKNSTR